MPAVGSINMGSISSMFDQQWFLTAISSAGSESCQQFSLSSRFCLQCVLAAVSPASSELNEQWILPVVCSARSGFCKQ